MSPPSAVQAWALAPFWIALLLLMLHQLYLLGLWRCLRPRRAKRHADEVTPTCASASASASASAFPSDEMQQAIGFAIREELAKSGDLDEAVAKARGLVQEAERKGISVSEAARQQLHRPPQPWLALADDFEEALGRPPLSEQERYITVTLPLHYRYITVTPPRGFGPFALQL